MQSVTPSSISARRQALLETAQTRLPRIPASVRWGSWRIDTPDRGAPEERRRRRWAALWSGGIHMVFMLMWMWTAWIRIPPPPPAVAEAGQADSLQVEYITLEPPQDTTPLPDAPAPAQKTANAPSSAQADAVATPQEPAPAPQPLLLTQTDQVDSDFVLPPTRVDPLPTPSSPVATPELTVPQRNVTLEAAVALPEVPLQPVPPALRPVPETPAVDATVPIAQREIPLEPVPVPAPVVVPRVIERPRDVPAPQPTVSVPRRDVPLRPTPPAPASAPTQPTRVPAPSAPAPRASAPAVASDDWDAPAGTRPGQAPGTGSGLLGQDGRAALPTGAAATAGGGLPPGSDDWTREGIDGHGTWLKRPPLDYRASPFEEYWRPNETLLEEWVRRGIKQMEIPIPGTSKRITCVVSLLQLGGGCGITDPNVNDQEAIARPPPDIPYKPELDQARPGPPPPANP